MFNIKFETAIAIRNSNPFFAAKKRIFAAGIFAMVTAAQDIKDPAEKRAIIKHVIRKIAEAMPNTAKWCSSTVFITKEALAILEAAGKTPLDLASFADATALKLKHEHAMPNSVFYDFAVELVERGGTVEELESFLGNNFSVITTHEEAKVIDKPSPNVNHNSKMPEGWLFTDAPYARYAAAGLLESLVFNEWYYGTGVAHF